MSDINRTEFEELLGEYWAIAFSEGRTGVSRGDDASLMLHKIRTARAQPIERAAMTDDQIVQVFRSIGTHTSTTKGAIRFARAILSAQAAAIVKPGFTIAASKMNTSSCNYIGSCGCNQPCDISLTQHLIAEAALDDALTDRQIDDFANKNFSLAFEPQEARQFARDIESHSPIAAIMRDDVTGDAKDAAIAANTKDAQ